MTVAAAAGSLAATAADGWRGQLSIVYRSDGGRTTAHDTHSGPLRVLRRLYPEGPGICHHVLVHPPGGVVGGDVLQIDATLGPGCHAVVTTPGATRFYRSDGAPALQQATLTLDGGARLEWLPLESIAHSGCIAENRVQLALQPGAEAMGWDVLALGLPAAGQPFAAGRYLQHLELQGVWLDRGAIRGDDRLLLDGGPGLAGRSVLATLWFAAGRPLATPLREALLGAARECIANDAGLAATAGATSPQPQVVVLRALAHRVEPAMALLQQVRAAWRQLAWQLAPNPSRVWRT